MPLTYHSGQIEVQTEANTRKLADQLAHWVGPVAEFATTADLVLLASRTETGELAFSAVSGAPPLAEIAGPNLLRFPMLHADGIEGLAGGLAISLAQLRRARINGRLSMTSAGAVLQTQETFTLCRKYIVASGALQLEPMTGPAAREAIGLRDPWLMSVVERAETSFLASSSPDGQPDIAHRGGLPGFLKLDSADARLTWPEFIGDGVFKSAGNIRASGYATLLVPDLQSGDAVELRGKASYRTLRTMKQARLDALEQHKDPFPVQGEMSMEIESAQRLRALIRPRRRIEKTARVTSRSPAYEQAPQ